MVTVKKIDGVMPPATERKGDYSLVSRLVILVVLVVIVLVAASVLQKKPPREQLDYCAVLLVYSTGYVILIYSMDTTNRT
jgi:hypothetical protein